MSESFATTTPRGIGSKASGDDVRGEVNRLDQLCRLRARRRTHIEDEVLGTHVEEEGRQHRHGLLA